MNATMRILLPVMTALLFVAACSDEASETQGPAEAYTAFYQGLAEGETDAALEELAPEGALGSTFRSAGYYMAAREFEDQVDAHGAMESVVVETEETVTDNEIMVHGHIRFRDGTEVPRAIRFTREGDHWVGHL